MTLKRPFIIGPRLLPALAIGGGYLSLDRKGFVIDLPDGSGHRIDDFRPGAGNRDISSWFAAMLAFLGASAESRRYRERVKRSDEIDPDSNEVLFPPSIVDWAAENSDEIGMLEIEIEESEEELIAD